MVEVFKTNVDSEHEASNIINALHCKFQHYKSNFDLEDCDRILRVESENGTLKVFELLRFLGELGLNVKVLPD